MSTVIAAQHAPGRTFSLVAWGLFAAKYAPERSAAVPDVKRKWALRSSRDFYAESRDTALLLYSTIRF